MAAGLRAVELKDQTSGTVSPRKDMLDRDGQNQAAPTATKHGDGGVVIWVLGYVAAEEVIQHQIEDNEAVSCHMVFAATASSGSGLVQKASEPIRL